MALYKRPNSKYWWMKFTFDGQLIQQSTKCSNKRDALTVESAYRTQLALGKIGIEPKQKAPTFSKAVDDFLVWLKVEHAAQPNTYQRYHFSAGLLKKYLGSVKVDRINKKTVEDFIVWRSGQTSRKTKDFITRETINNELLTLKMILKRLVESKILHDNPARGVKQLKANERNFHVITRDEEKLYLLAAPQPLQDVAIVMLETGMRCCEVYPICRQDVSLERGFLQVVKGKTASSIRQVHLSDRAQDVLRCRAGKFTGENLFPQNDIDGARATFTLDRLHLETVRKLKMKFRLYDARHTFASRAVEDGIDLLVLASILGHSNLKMVMRYAHPSETFKADAIKRMEINKKAKAV
ncbi:MAG: tyrosine-type recombinase/integrase [Acidobacteriota bacterium]|nr:tyrosine-type recombinase/integrase [Acidobacteriota bacterium]